ncbi:MAG: polysaccharide deacetylase family protein [candidate division WOR-3 bacterium]
MKKLRRICKKHKLPLTRKCYRCKKSICKKEFFKKYHHIFCSKKCAYLWKIEKYYLTEPVRNLIFYSLLVIFSIIFIFGVSKIRNLPVYERMYIKKIPVKMNEETFDIKKIMTDEKIVCLTFDGGFYANRVDSIIEILKRENIGATFFLTGEFIKRYPEKVNKIAENFEVGNHTFSHPHLTSYEINKTHKTLSNINQIKIIEELLLCEEIFEKLTNKKMERIWRAPYGEENHEIKEWAKRIGYTHIRWTYDTEDWKEKISYEEILKDIVSKKNLNGYIFLLHLGSPYEHKEFYIFLKSLIKELRKRGYKFLSIKEALKYHKIMM